MSRKEANTADVSGEAVKYSEGDRHAIVGGSPATELVENDERSRSGL